MEFNRIKDVPTAVVSLPDAYYDPISANVGYKRRHPSWKINSGNTEFVSKQQTMDSVLMCNIALSFPRQQNNYFSFSRCTLAAQSRNTGCNCVRSLNREHYAA